MHNEDTNHSLSKKAIDYWRVEEMLSLGVAIAIFGGLIGCTFYWSWPKWLMYLFGLILVACVISSIVSISRLQKKYDYYRYSYDEHFFYIREGVWTKRFAIIPFEKIQAVTLFEGGLLSQFQLAAIELQVIEKVYRIPALQKETALNIQRELAELTKQKEVHIDETISTTHRV